MTDNATTTETRGVGTAFALTSAQQEIWIGSALIADASGFTAGALVAVTGPVDLDRLRASMKSILAVADPLHISIRDDDGGFAQEHSTEPVPLVTVDLSDRPDPDAAARAWIETDMHVPYDLSHGPLARTAVLVLAPDRVLAYLSVHHIVGDGISIATVLAAVIDAYYRGGSAAPQPNWSAEALSEADRAYRESPRLAIDTEFWKSFVAAAPPAGALCDTSIIPVGQPANVEVEVSYEVSHRLFGLAEQCGVGTSRVVFAAAIGYLHSVTGLSDMTVAVPMSGRTTAPLRANIGSTSNVLPFRARLLPGDTVRTLTARLHRELGAIKQHSNFRGEAVSRLARSSGRTERLMGAGINILPAIPVLAAGEDLRWTVDLVSAGPVGDIEILIHVDHAAKVIRSTLRGPRAAAADLDHHRRAFAAYLTTIPTDADARFGPAFATPVTRPAQATGPLAPLPGVEDLLRAGADALPSAAVTRLPVPAELGENAVHAVVQALVDRHDSLRLRAEELAPGLWDLEVRPVGEVVAAFTTDPIDPRTLIHAEEGVVLAATFTPGSALPTEFATGTPASRDVNTTSDSLGGLDTVAGADDSSDPEPGPMETPSAAGELALAIHPLAADAFSWPVLAAELAASFAQLLRGQPIALPTPAATLRDFAEAANTEATSPELVAQLPTWQRIRTSSTRPFTTWSPDHAPRTEPIQPTAESDPSDAPPSADGPTPGESAASPLDDPTHTEPLAAPPTLTTAPGFANAGTLATATGGAGTDSVCSEPVRLQVPVEQFARDLAALAVWIESAVLASITLATGEICGIGRPDASIVVDVARDGRTLSEMDAAGQVGRFGITAPVALRVQTDPVVALAQARQRLREQDATATGYALLRHLNPQSQLLLDSVDRADFALSVVDHSALGSATVDLPTAPRTAPLSIDIVVRDLDARRTLDATITADDTVHPDLLAEFARVWAKTIRELAELAADPANRVNLVPADLKRIELTVSEVTAVESVSPALLQDIWPLSPLQQGLFFQSAYATDASPDIYTAQFTLEFDRALDPVPLRQALTDLLRAHPALRAGFVDAGLPEPVQIVARDPQVRLRVVDLSALSPAESAERVEAALAQDRATGFELAAPPLWRATLYQRAGAGSLLAVNRQFMLWDGWSNGPFIGALLAGYAAHAAGETPVVQQHYAFAEYLTWTRGQDIEAARQYWHTSLAELTEPCLVRPDATMQVAVSPEVRTVSLSRENSAALEQVAAQHSVTVNTVLNAALALTISRLLGRSDIVFGNTVAGRPPEIPDIGTAIGMFLNTVPVRVRLRPDLTPAELFAQVHHDRLDRMEHEHLPLSRIIESTSHRQLFDVLFVLQNFIDDATLGAEHGIIGGTSLDHTHYPLTIVVTPGPQLTVKLESRPDLVEAEQAQRFLDEFTGLLDLFATESLTAPLATVDTGALAGATIAGHVCEVGTDSIADLLAAQSLRTPDAEALVLGERTLTFAELDAEINRLARVLNRTGARPETYVALAIPRTIEMVVALFAVLRTGAGYVPLELEHPDDRLHAILTKATPGVLLTTESAADRFDVTVPALVLDSEKVLAELAATDPSPLADAELGTFARTNPDRLTHPAYVIFTSGSTGEPKGVVTPYAGLTNMQLNHEREIFAPAIELAGGGRLRIAHTVSFAFDMSWEELLWLAFGHTVHVCDEELRRDPTALVDYCDTHRIDVLNVTPTYAEHLIAEGLLAHDPATGKHRPALVLLGGEAVGVGVWDALRDTESTYGYNLYGPTEYTINTLGGGTYDSPTPTVGRPIFNTDAYLLDSWLRPVPDGSIGELYVSGIGLARGYLDHPALTAERFVADPAAPGQRMYRTGDLVRLDAAGNLEFHGRSDDQVKIRGYRVEPSEIAAVLSGLADIERAVVIADKSEDSARLLAFVVLTPGTAAQRTDAIRGELAGLLPSYMVPSSVTALATIPMTVNGKLDVSALPISRATGGASRPPRTVLERVLCETFSEVLGRVAGVEDSFFDLGGHSLLIMTLRRALRDRLDLDIPIADLFGYATPETLAAKIEGGGGVAKMTAPVLTLRHGDGDPVFCLPPGTGLGWQYTQLTRYIPEDAPVHAIQSPFITGEREVSTDLAELACRYADLVVATAPDRDYRLIGWSFGGNVAIAVAAELRARGHRVPSVVLLDSAAEVPREYLERAALVSPAAAALLSLGIAVPPTEFETLGIADAVARVRATENFMAHFDTDTIEAVIHGSAWSLTVMTHAQYPVFDGDVLFVRAAAGARVLTAEAARRWEPFVGGALRLVEVEATHAQMLDRTVVDAYGPELERELTR
ncbi:amino acid adenylation domain-containing protein [Nocardia lasii]|uniref:Amino acid adenylation domain-containing protein n=1 Tax=Nocardia lasii TaxID=1616107 RepID=A0ABW1JPZ6_9NOCA